MLYDEDRTKTCCDDKYLRKQSTSDVCCGGHFYPKITNYQCCHGKYKLVQPGQVCCQDNHGAIYVGDGNTCCDGRPYNNNTKYCVCGALYDDNTRKCCGGQVVAVAQKCCGGPESGRVYLHDDPGKKCCGNNYVPVSSLCCQSDTGYWKVRFEIVTNQSSRYTGQSTVLLFSVDSTKQHRFSRVTLVSSCSNTASVRDNSLWAKETAVED